MNKAILIGRLTRDPELRYTKSNIACATFKLAINNGKDNEGKKRQADFINCVIWEQSAENMAKYTKKGSQIALEGSIKNEKWQDEYGNNRYRTYVLARRIIFLDNQKSKMPIQTEPDYLNKQSFKSEEIDDIQIDDKDLPF